MTRKKLVITHTFTSKFAWTNFKLKLVQGRRLTNANIVELVKTGKFYDDINNIKYELEE